MNTSEYLSALFGETATFPAVLEISITKEGGRNAGEVRLLSIFASFTLQSVLPFRWRLRKESITNFS